MARRRRSVCAVSLALGSTSSGTRAARRWKSSEGGCCGAISTLDAAAIAPAPIACASGTGPQMRKPGMLASALSAPFKPSAPAFASVTTEWSWRPPSRHANAAGCGPTEKERSSSSPSRHIELKESPFDRDGKSLFEEFSESKTYKDNNSQNFFLLFLSTAAFTYQVPLFTAGGFLV